MTKIRALALALTCSYMIAITLYFGIFVWHRSPAEVDEVQNGAPDASVREDEPKFKGLGIHTRKITTTSVNAQEYFAQGLAFLYGFNHEEASRSFRAAAESDPSCAMAYWGIAMANGPHINNMVVTSVRARAAWRAFKRARKLASGSTPVERALIEAVGKRYADPPPQNRNRLDEAYAEAMQKVWKDFPEDADVGALTAEALIDLHPWNQWTHDGAPQPGTEELLKTLDAVISKYPMHPLALHLLIHAVEASPHPERADFAADRLRDLAPALDHITHMPSHIDVRRGRWQAAVFANEKAIAAEKAYGNLRPKPFYHIPMAHNHHMLAYAAMMQGQSQKATEAIGELLAAMPDDYVRQNADTVDGFFGMPYELHLRFGRWDAMLKESKPRESFPITMALWHYGRGIALAAKRRVDEAKAEWDAFLLAEMAVPNESFFRKTAGQTYLGIAEKMLEGEILYRQRKVDGAVTALREAVRREDSLHYTEPPNWILPVRHALGATLLNAGRYVEAESVYREDLARYPENGWSLYGLARSLRMQHRTAEAAAVDARFQKAWQYADVKLSSSCFCLQARN